MVFAVSGLMSSFFKIATDLKCAGQQAVLGHQFYKLSDIFRAAITFGKDVFNGYPSSINFGIALQIPANPF